MSCIKIDLFKHCTVSPGEEFYKWMKRFGLKGRVEGFVLCFVQVGFEGWRVDTTTNADMVPIRFPSTWSLVAALQLSGEASICITRYVL